MYDKIENNKEFRVVYQPSNWPSIKRFREFNEDKLKYQTVSLLWSVELRFEKIQLLWNHFNYIGKNLQPEEEKILKTWGEVDPVHSKLMAAIFEAILNEFYSINDHVVKILRNLFPKKNLPESMSRLITKTIDYKLPEPLSSIVSGYTMCQKLNKIRTESAHFSSGFIKYGAPTWYLNYKSGPMNEPRNNIVLIEDVAKFYLDQLAETHTFVNSVFGYLESTWTNDNRSKRVCGFYDSLAYQRLESYLDWKTGQEGVCTPIWEVNVNAEICPLAKSCKAYANYRLEKQKKE